MVDVEATLRSSLDGRYAIEGEVGRGGMSVVYRARDLKHNRTVAIKVLKPELSAAVSADRFQREIEIVAGLTHPHILPLHDSGDADGLLYYVMPFVEAGSLSARIGREGALPEADAIRIAREIADALGYAHDHEIIHRDVKPGNILLSGDHALLADFGIAHLATGVLETLTEAGLALGTPAYFSPEQASGEDEVDGRSDIYSLGCVLYEALTGSAPFAGDSARAMLVHHMLDTPPPVRSLVEGISPDAEAIVETAIRKDPDERFQTGEQMAQALDLAGGRIAGIPAAVLRRMGISRLRRDRARLAIAAATAVMAAAGLFAVRGWVGGGEQVPPRAHVRYVVLEHVPDDASESEKALSLLAARTLRDLLGGWTTVSVVPEPALQGPTAAHLVAGFPQSSFALGTNLAQQFDADYLVHVQASNVRAVSAPAGGGFQGDMRIRTWKMNPSNGEILGDTTTIGPLDSLDVMMTGVAMQLLELEGEPEAYVSLQARSPDHRAVQELDAGRRALWSWRLAEAHRLFESAIVRDSSFALAHFRLAQTMYWEMVHDEERLRELGPLIDYHSTQAEREGGGSRLRPRERDAVAAFRAFWKGDYDLSRARYDSLIEFEPADLEALVLRGAVEIEDPILVEREDGSRVPRQNLNVARAMFDTATALNPKWELSWGHLHAIDRQVVEAAYSGSGYGFELPGDAFIAPYEIRNAAEQMWYCPVLQADTIYWAVRGLAGCSADSTSRAEAAAMHARTVKRLDHATTVELDQPRHHEELTEFLLWERSRAGCDAEPMQTDSLTQAARMHVERALEMRRDTTPQDRILLASLYLASGDHEAAVTATERALADLPDWQSRDRTPPPVAAANPFLATGSAGPAVGILERVLFESSVRILDPYDETRKIDTNGTWHTMNALLVLGTLGERGPEVAGRIARLRRAWRDTPKSKRDRVALRLASLPWVGPALAHSPDEWDEWFGGWDEFGLEVPPVWQGIFAASESPADLSEARARLDEAVEELNAGQDGPIYVEDLYLPLVLAYRIGATDVERDLRGRFSRCALLLDSFDPGWGMQYSLGFFE